MLARRGNTAPFLKNHQQIERLIHMSSIANIIKKFIGIVVSSLLLLLCIFAVYGVWQNSGKPTTKKATADTSYSVIDGRPSVAIPYKMTKPLDKNNLAVICGLVAALGFAATLFDIGAIKQSKNKFLTGIGIGVSIFVTALSAMASLHLLDIANPRWTHILGGKAFLSLPFTIKDSGDHILLAVELVAVFGLAIAALIDDLQRSVK